MREKILIVDDDPLICQGLSQVLREDYEVETANSGEDALEKIEKDDFDIVLTDLVMPGASGIQVLKKVKNLKPITRVILITAYAAVKNAVEAMKEGATDYISKPFELKEVKNVIRRALKEAKFERDRMDIEQGLRAEQLQISTDKNSILKTLSNPIRREALELLDKQERSFTDILKELNVEDPTKLSFHLRMLRISGLVMQDEERVYLLTSEGKEVAKLLRYLDRAAGMRKGA